MIFFINFFNLSRDLITYFEFFSDLLCVSVGKVVIGNVPLVFIIKINHNALRRPFLKNSEGWVPLLSQLKSEICTSPSISSPWIPTKIPKSVTLRTTPLTRVCGGYFSSKPIHGFFSNCFTPKEI